MEEESLNKNKVRAHILISGHVQGVFFRDTTRRKAEELRVVGFVRNLPDGKVEMILEGEKSAIENMIEWARQGPDSARVENIETEWENFRDEFSSFSIIY